MVRASRAGIIYHRQDGAPALRQRACPIRMNHTLRFLLLLVLATASVTALAIDTSSLRPPKGAKVAIIVFEDLQCPDCRAAEPLLEEAAAKYKIPLVRHDFPLPQHSWSYDAHVMAHYFASKSPQLGEEFWRYIFNNQPSITRLNLRGFAERFAEEHKTDLPSIYDPRGEFAAAVQAEFRLAQTVGADHTPTIFVVSNMQRGTPFIEVVDRSQLFDLIEKLLKEADAK